MSFLLAGFLVAGAGGAMAVGRWIARRAKDGSAKVAPPPSAVAEAKEDALVLEGFPCQLGDVVMRSTGEEAWLAGALVLSEAIPVAVLFVAPEAGLDRCVHARPHPNTSIVWYAPLDPSAVLVGAEPPSVVEHERIRFERVRRLPLRARRLGVGAPDLGDAVIVAEYVSSGSERLLVLKGSDGTYKAFRGEELDAAQYEVIASGSSTLDQ